ncbi:MULTISPECIES: acyl-CoA thioesterase [Niallia]|uniref:acyl-CoA thioesterase n=1 Tax=Niallia TaxID=2837506 RepID=UPI003009C934
MKNYSYQHTVSFEETNLVGNVYYTNYVKWQGICREFFLKDKAPDIIDLLQRGLYLVTTKVSCQYLSELFAFDRVEIKMFSGGTKLNKVKMLFEYWKVSEDSTPLELVCRGEQEIACLYKEDGQLKVIEVPDSLKKALKKYEVVNK